MHVNRKGSCLFLFQISFSLIVFRHFLSMNCNVATPEVSLDFQPSYGTCHDILQMWKNGQSYLTKCWNIWLTEYLPSLRERRRNEMKASKGEIVRQPICGEIVLVREDGLSRGKWKMAKIVNLVESAVDKVVRAVTIKYPSGRIGKRPLRDIFPLECGVSDE